MIGGRQSNIDFIRVYGLELWETWPSDVLGPFAGEVYCCLARIASNLMDVEHLYMRMRTQLSNMLDGTNYYVPNKLGGSDET